MLSIVNRVLRLLLALQLISTAPVSASDPARTGIAPSTGSQLSIANLPHDAIYPRRGGASVTDMLLAAGRNVEFETLKGLLSLEYTMLEALSAQGPLSAENQQRLAAYKVQSLSHGIEGILGALGTKVSKSASSTTAKIAEKAENLPNFPANAVSTGAGSAADAARLPMQLAAEQVAGARMPTTISGYTRHGLHQAISRDGVGVSAEAILNTWKNLPKLNTYQPVECLHLGSQGMTPWS